MLALGRDQHSPHTMMYGVLSVCSNPELELPHVEAVQTDPEDGPSNQRHRLERTDLPSQKSARQLLKLPTRCTERRAMSVTEFRDSPGKTASWVGNNLFITKPRSRRCRNITHVCASASCFDCASSSQLSVCGQADALTLQRGNHHLCAPHKHSQDQREAKGEHTVPRK